jgi:hypothetical protein
MPRTYSTDFVDTVQGASSYRLGIDLAATCIKAKFPAAYVAQVFNTSRQTIYSWFRGSPIRFKKRAKIETFIELVEEDLKRGLLPCKNLADARAYLKDMIGHPIKVG